MAREDSLMPHEIGSLIAEVILSCKNRDRFLRFPSMARMQLSIQNVKEKKKPLPFIPDPICHMRCYHLSDSEVHTV
jgi:hypothetical protein